MKTADILVVCTGNICRSPLIERLLQPALDARYGQGTVTVRSAGTGALVGYEMDARSATILQGLGGRPDGFRARRLTAEMVRDASLILTATRAHRAAVVKLWPRALRRAFTMRELADLVDRGMAAEVADLATDPLVRLTEIATRAGAQRGRHRLIHPDDLDIIDPFRREDEVYTLMRSQVRASLPPVLHALGADDGAAPGASSEVDGTPHSG